jgi:hypothetical protein
MAAVPFALTQPLSGIWKVYAAASGDALAPGVTALSLGSTLTLSHGSDVPWGTYYVSVTEPGLAESIRAALTVVGEYSITYHLDGVEGPADTVYQANTLPCTLPVLSRQDKVFMGWYDNESFTGSPVTEIAEGSIGAKNYWAWWVDPPPPIDVGSPGTGGLRWSYAEGVITLQDGANVTLTGSTAGEAANRVVVEPGASVIVKLSNVSITRTYPIGDGSAWANFSGDGATVVLLLEGENTVTVSAYYTGGQYAFNVANLIIDSASSVNAGTDASSRSTLGTLRASAGGLGDMHYGEDPGAAFGDSLTLLGGVVTAESGYDNFMTVYGSAFTLKGGVFITSTHIYARGANNVSTFSRPADSTGIVFAGEWIHGYNRDFWVDWHHNYISQALPNTAGDLIITGSEEVAVDAEAKTITLNAPLTIPNGVTLRIPADWTLKLNNHTLTIETGGTVLCSDWPGGSVLGDLTGHSDSGAITN